MDTYTTANNTASADNTLTLEKLNEARKLIAEMGPSISTRAWISEPLGYGISNPFMPEDDRPHDITVMTTIKFKNKREAQEYMDKHFPREVLA